MESLFPIIVIIGGLVAASSLLIAKKPDAKELFDKIAPYQGFVGIAMLVVGFLWLFRTLPHIGGIMKAAPIQGVVAMGTIVGAILVGFLLGYGLLSSLLAKNETAKEKGAQALAKIAKVQVPLGLITAGFAVATYIV